MASSKLKPAYAPNPEYYYAHMANILDLVALSEDDYNAINRITKSLKRSFLKELPFLQGCDMFGSISRRASLNQSINPRFDIDILLTSNFSHKYVIPSKIRDSNAPVDFSGASPNAIAAWNRFYSNPEADLLEEFVKHLKRKGANIVFDTPCATLEYSGYRFDIVYADSIDDKDSAVLLPVKKPFGSEVAKLFDHSRYSSYSVSGSKNGGKPTSSILLSFPWYYNEVRDWWMADYNPDPSKAIVLIKYIFIANGINIPSFYIEADFYNALSNLAFIDGMSLLDFVIMFFTDKRFYYPPLYRRIPNFNAIQDSARQYLKYRDINRHDLAIPYLIKFCPPPDADLGEWQREMMDEFNIREQTPPSGRIARLFGRLVGR